MVKNDGSIATTISNLADEDEANRIFLAVIVATLIVSAYTTFDVMRKRDDVVSIVTQKTWSIEFNETITGEEYQDVWQDEESRIVEFYMDNEGIAPPPGYYVGMINITISPDTIDGFSVFDPVAQCDSIAASVIVNDLTAQWESEQNELSGQDSSCEDIHLTLITYPDFNGDNITSQGANEFQILEPWKMEGWGEGVLEIQIDLDVNTAEPGPFAADDDEEITILVEVICFSATAMMV
ncbi:MAG TPA: hypothetical protein D7I12_04290 [Candidatus Poseidoniales archaeon]|nr:MAG TPA: hypothetical protein D7I12_04290 [Candidatus Poseidoniales archaeon]